MSPLIVVVGPTGSGKSSLAVHLARSLHGEVVNCDSVQVFRGFDAGTAKITAAEQQGIPHWLIDIRDPGELFTAGDYAKEARPVLAGITARRHLPIVCGGTGFYVRALVDGLFEGPPRDEALRTRLAAREARRPGSVHRLLTRFDRQAAARIHVNDVNKTVRAVEVALTARRPLTELHAEGRDALQGYRILMIGLNPPRPALHVRLDARLAVMFERGLLDEVRELLARGCSPECKPFESLGYAQALRVVRGEMTAVAALAEAQLRTRQYAKRQWTWFRRDPRVEWIDGFGGDAAVEQAAAKKVAQWLEQFRGSSV